ncbi:MAG: type II secretion system F family protein [Candidatus Aenigmarchaeota archaeon]|nr:type II secretion system F family protein [Candidatus Aenigmarchaeota archaeon]
MKMRTITLLSIAAGSIIFIINYRFFQHYEHIFMALNIVAILIALVLPLGMKYEQFSRIKKIETLFPIFLRDITDNIKSGMTLPQAIRASTSNNYGVLTNHVKELSAKIEWGISFENALNNFAERVGSNVIKRTVQSIIEAHESGGTIDSVLEVVASSVQEIEKINKKRATRIYSQMLNGYFIYFIFLGVMYAMTHFLLPAFQFAGSQAGIQEIFNEMFRNLVVIQGIFAGLAIGKMAEGTITAGFKHSFFLVVMGYSVLTLL